MKRWFKWMALCCFFLADYPVAVLIGAIASPDAVPMYSGIYWGAAALCGVLAYGAGAVSSSLRTKHPIPVNLSSAAFCVMLGILCALLLPGGWPAVLGAGINAGIVAFLAFQKEGLAYGEIFTRPGFLFDVIAGLVVSLLLFLMDVPPPAGMMCAAFFLTAALYALVGNQANIDFLMERRKHKMENLPRKIRSYNLRMTLLAVGGLGVLFLLRDWVTALIIFVRNGIIRAFDAVMRFFLWLGSLIPDVEAVPEEIPIQEKVEPELKPGYDSSWILFLVLGLVVLLLILRYRRRIGRFFLSVFQGLAAFFRRWLGNRGIFRQDDASGEYVDEEHFLAQEERLQEKGARAQRREWLREARRFQKEAPSPAAFRKGYGLLLEGLRLRGAELPLSYTPLEAVQAAQESGLAPSGGEEVTEDYLRLRYRLEELGTEEHQRLRLTLEELRKAVLRP